MVSATPSASLTRMPHVRKAAIQTNLSCKLDWVDACDRTGSPSGATFHPREIDRETLPGEVPRTGSPRRPLQRRRGRPQGTPRRDRRPFAASCRRTSTSGSTPTSASRTITPPEMVSSSTAHRPAVPDQHPLPPQPGRAMPGRATVISVDGDGTVRRCHFIREPIGNLYAPDFEACPGRAALHERHLRLPHRLRPPGPPRVVRRLRRGCAGRIPLGYR